MKIKKAKWFWLIRILLRMFVVALVLLFALIFTLNIPAVQTFIVAKIAKSIREKTGSEISIGSVKIAFPKTVQIIDLYVQDKDADTLLYMHSLHVDIDLFRLLHNNFRINSIELETVVANIFRKNNEKKFNFQFIIDVFSADTTQQADKTKKPGKPWSISVKDIKLKNIRATYLDDREGIDVRMDLDDFEATVNDIDLDNKLLDLDKILLKNTTVQLSLSQSEDNVEVQVVKNNTSIPGNNPDSKPTRIFLTMKILADQLTIKNTSFSLENANSPGLLSGIDYQHLNISNLNASIHNIKIDSAGYKAKINNMSFTESCGFNLKELAGDAQFTAQRMGIKNLRLETSLSKIEADVEVAYTSFSDFLKDFGNSSVMLDIQNSVVHTDELYLFSPALAAESFASEFKNSEVFITVMAEGEINDLDLENLEISLLQETSLKTHGRLTGLPDMTKIGFNVTIEHFSTTLKNVYQFVDPAFAEGLELPNSFELKGTVKGKKDSLKADIRLISAFGSIMADAFYQINGSARQDTFSIDFAAEQIAAGTILSDTLLGEISFTGKADGSGLAAGNLFGNAFLDILEAQYNTYTYKDIRINGRKVGNVFSATATCNDPHLNFNLWANADLSGQMQKYSAQLSLPNLNLKALNFTEQSISLSTYLTAELSYGWPGYSEASIRMGNSSLFLNQDTIPVQEMEISAGMAPDSLNIQLDSDLADASIFGNINPANLNIILQSAYRQYFGLPDSNQVQADKHLDFTIDLHIPKNNLSHLIPGLDSLVITKLAGSYHSDSNDLSFAVLIPAANYSNIQFDSLSLGISGKNDSLSLEFLVGKVSSDSLKIKNLRILEQVNKGKILSEISTSDTLGVANYLFANHIELGDDFFSIRFLPDGLVLDGINWRVDKDNYLEIRKNLLSSRQFDFTHEKQSFGFIADSANQKLVFNNFSIQNLVNFIEIQKGANLIAGDLTGQVEIPLTGEQWLINASLAISNLYILDSLAGNLVFNARMMNDSITIESSLENEENKIGLKGDVAQLSGTPLLDLEILLDINNLGRFEKYTFGALSDLSGKIDGEVSLTGSVEEPELNGNIGFNETSFKINDLNLLARMDGQKIFFNEKGIHFDNFMIDDARDKHLTINGDILTSSYTDFDFDLNIVTQNFQPVNSTAVDNPQFFGKLSLNTDINLRGNIKSPEIEADILIDSATNLTYVLPGSKIKLVTSEGIVYFLNPAETNDSLLTGKKDDYITDSIMSQFTGMNFAVNLEIDPDAKFRLDIDPKSGDYLTIGGSAKLSIAVDSTGKQSINGTYEVRSGFYQLSFYDLAGKKFMIKPGSTISWNGKPMDADVNITAEYTVKTASVGLMANESNSMSETEKSMFRQSLPYLVSLNIRGLLAQPEISFSITLPEKDLMANPLIAAKLTELNTEEMESELNKQVFALLVTGTFIADPSGSTGGSGSNAATTAAHNSVNGILAGQMNKVSSKYIRHINLNFGLTTFDDGSEGSGDTRTELDIQVSKKLFNDRVTVEAQSAVNFDASKNSGASSAGQNSDEIAITYDLTKEGQYKLRAYAENGYDLFDGDINYSGIAVIFEKELDSLRRQKHKDKPDKKDKKQAITN